MPSPLGHALAGLAAGWLVYRRPSCSPEPTFRTDLRHWKRWGASGVAFGLAGILPDADLFVGAHSRHSHSIGAAALAGALTFLLHYIPGSWSALTSRLARGGDAWRLALAVTCAYGSHILLDWMGNDTTAPIGIMALWPLTDQFYQSHLKVFGAISRRYWLAGFWSQNIAAAMRELAYLLPIVVMIWWSRRRPS